MIQENLIKVGMAEMDIARHSGVLKTTGLGSCVGLTLYDPVAKIGGMAHIMLPSSEIARETAYKLGKYADTAIPELIRQMTENGANAGRLQAKLAGGAQMFAFSSDHDSLRIGARNVETCKTLLEHFRIPLISEDTGGNYGRTIEFFCETGRLQIRSVHKGVKEI